MRISVAAMTGVVLALLIAFGVVRVATTAEKDPVARPLYNYGSR